MKRFLMWTSAWVDLVVCIIDIVTFGFWYLSWDLDYYTYITGDDISCTELRDFDILVHATDAYSWQYEVSAYNEMDARVIAYCIHNKPVTVSVDSGHFAMMLRYTEVI